MKHRQAPRRLMWGNMAAGLVIQALTPPDQFKTEL